jgi:hypothetical protein
VFALRADGRGAPDVQGMAAVGVRQDLICTQIRNRATGAPIHRKTLRRAFRAELTAGMIEATRAVITALFENAVVHRNVTAQIFWLKNRAPNEWRDRTEREHGGEFGLRSRSPPTAPRPNSDAPGRTGDHRILASP